MTAELNQELWMPIKEEVLKMLSEESKELWESTPNKQYLDDIATRMAKHKARLKIASASGNQNAIYQHKSSLESLGSLLEAQEQGKTSPFLKVGSSLFYKTVNLIGKSLAISAMNSKMGDLSEAEKKELESMISASFDSAKIEQPLTGGSIMVKLEVESIMKEIKPLVEQVAQAKNWTDYLKVTMPAITIAMGLAADYKEKTGEQKKAFVVEAFQKSYKEVNPNLPFIDGPMEDFVENYFLSSLLPAMIDQIWATHKILASK